MACVGKGGTQGNVVSVNGKPFWGPTGQRRLNQGYNAERYTEMWTHWFWTVTTFSGQLGYGITAGEPQMGDLDLEIGMMSSKGLLKRPSLPPPATCGLQGNEESNGTHG